jgi:Ca2+-binding EF-hand superfamily protein
LHSIIHHNDVDGNGSLDWDEFLAIMRRGVIDPDEKYIFDLFFDNSER